MKRARKTAARFRLRHGTFIGFFTVLALLLDFSAASATTKNDHDEAVEQRDATADPPENIALFDLHDPQVMDRWAAFLATTPMLNDVLLPSALQDRLQSIVRTYRLLTPEDRPTFFVATYFDLLSERLLTVATAGGGEIFPMQVCPVFASGPNASTSELLAEASGLPEELFVHSAGKPERYRYLFLQTEFSHCEFLENVVTTAGPPERLETDQYATSTIGHVSFYVDGSSYSAVVSTKKELRALLETIGDIDAIARFRTEFPNRNIVDEAEILIFVRLLSLLATDGTSGYAAIPILFPMVSQRGDQRHATDPEPLLVADVLATAYRTREVFRRIVPFSIRNTDDLRNAKLAVMQALAEAGDFKTTDQRSTALLRRFVTGSDLLLATNAEDEKMPLTND